MTATTHLNFPGVYTITCTSNGRVYVGQAVNIRKRWTHHKWQLNNGTHDNPKLQRAWRKYGADAFVFAVSADLRHLSGDALSAAMMHAEEWTMAGVTKSFNLIDAAPGASNPSSETRAKLSADRKARWADPEYRSRVIASMKAKAADPEFQKRRGAAISAGMSKPEYREQRGKISKAMWADGAFKEARGAERRANWQDPAYREGQKASRTATWVDPEVRARRTAALKASWADPEVRARRQAAMQAGKKR